MATNKFDKLNEMRQRSIPFAEYFGEMDLEQEEIEKRIKLADELDEMFYYFLAMLFEEEETPETIKAQMKEQFVEIVSDAFNDKINDGERMHEYINDIVEEIVDTTKNNASDLWYTSRDRASFIAEDQTNSVANYYRERQAIINGCTRKTWVTILDGHERVSHNASYGQTVDIEDSFKVGGYSMMYPKDNSLGAPAKEIINCRCTVRYT